MEHFTVYTDGWAVYSGPYAPHSKRVPAANVMSGLFHTNRTRMGLLPAAVRWVSHDGGAFLVERPPRVVSLKFAQGSAISASRKKKEMLLIPLPWTEHLIVFSDPTLASLKNLFVYARNSPIQKRDDELFYLPLPSSDTRGEVCLGANPNKTYQTLRREQVVSHNGAIDASTCINIVLTMMWQGNFNSDMHVFKEAIPPQLLEACPDHVGDPDQLMHVWEGFSVDDIVHWDWVGNGGNGLYPPMTVEQVTKSFDINKEEIKTLGHLLYTQGNFNV